MQDLNNRSDLKENITFGIIDLKVTKKKLRLLKEKEKEKETSLMPDENNYRSLRWNAIGLSNMNAFGERVNNLVQTPIQWFPTATHKTLAKGL